MASGSAEKASGGNLPPSLRDSQGDSPPEDEDSNVEVVAANNAITAGRKPHAVRQHFTATGSASNSQKRAACKCNYCGQEFSSGKSVPHMLQNHLLHHCKAVTPGIKDQLMAALADGKGPALPVHGKGKQPASSAGTGKAEPRQAGMAEFVTASKEGKMPEVIADAVSRDLLLAVVTGGVPLAFLENPFLRSALARLRPAFNPPGNGLLSHVRH